MVICEKSSGGCFGVETGGGAVFYHVASAALVLVSNTSCKFVTLFEIFETGTFAQNIIVIAVGAVTVRMGSIAALSCSRTG